MDGVEVDVGPEHDVVVVGGGIAGLTAARELSARGLRVTVLERESHSGGRIRTERCSDGYLEHGGIFHTEGYTQTRKLLADVGLADQVVATPTAFHSGVRDGGRFEHVDYGSVLGPLRFRSLGWRDRLSIVKAALPALLARPRDLGDLTSLSRFDDRAATAGLTERAATHFLAGPHEFLWGTDPRDLSFAMLALQLKVFAGELREVRGGIGQLTDRIADDLDVRHGSTVEAIEEHPVGVRVHVAGETQPVEARTLLLACPADVAATLWPDAPEPVRSHLRSVRYSRIDYVYLRTDRPVPLRAGGRRVGMEVVTTAEVGGGVLGGIYVADAWVRDGGLLLVTAAPAAAAAALTDEELADRLQADVERLHPELEGRISAERTVIRHDPYTPVVSPGSVRRVEEARRRLPAGRIDLAGDHMTAPWVEGAVRSGQQAAARLAGRLVSA